MIYKYFHKLPAKARLILALLIVLCLPVFAKAQSIMEQLPENCREDGTCQVNDLVKLLVIASQYIIAYSGVLALLFFVYGGVLFLISAGQSERVAKGKTIILGSLIGLAIVFFSYTIIKYVGDTLGVPGFNISTGWFGGSGG